MEAHLERGQTVLLAETSPVPSNVSGTFSGAQKG